MRRIFLWIVLPASASGIVVLAAYYAFAATLPKLDPTGAIPADAAFAAMIRGKPVYDLGSRRILWRKDYETKAEK